MGVRRLDSSTLNSASTACTYPVELQRLRAAVEEAVGRLPRWTLARSSGGGIEAVRRTRVFGFEDDVTVRFTEQRFGVRAELESASRVGTWDLGQNGRNLREIIEAVDRELTAAN